MLGGSISNPEQVSLISDDPVFATTNTYSDDVRITIPSSLVENNPDLKLKITSNTHPLKNHVKSLSALSNTLWKKMKNVSFESLSYLPTWFGIKATSSSYEAVPTEQLGASEESPLIDDYEEVSLRAGIANI